jgi:hypothetical protein
MANICLRLKTDLEGNTLSPSSPTPPLTPPVLQQEYIIGTDNTDEARRPRDSLAVTHNTERSTINDPGASSAQTGDCRPSDPTCAGSLVLTKTAGTELSGGPGAETDNIARGQGREGASQSAHCVTPGQELRTGLSNNTGNFSYYR